MTPGEALRAAIKTAGGQMAFARGIGLRSQGSVTDMLRRGYASAGRVLAIEALTGTSRHDLRPDLYPREERPVAGAVEPAAEAASA